MSKLNSILLIDDDNIVNYVNDSVIKRSGFTQHVFCVNDGLQAINFLKKQLTDKANIPDLIFLDINMPGMNGWEFLEEFKKIKEELKHPIIVVMLTTSLNPSDESRANNIIEISQFENKPLTQNALQKIVEKYFGS